MSRRPIETGGSLVFQEGKKIDGEYYIIAVYDDPERNTVTFAAYELESNQIFTLPYTYSELDGLFRYNSELMNPTNRDARYHWIIERLDFVVALDSTSAGRKLCLAPEPTPEEDTKKKKSSGDASLGGGKLDAATRARLIAELDTMNDHALFITLVKSQDVRSAFLRSLHSKRRLEQIKAQQRILKLDEDQEQRMKKLQAQRAFIKQKAVQYQEEDKVKKTKLQEMADIMNKRENEMVTKALKKKQQKQQERVEWRESKAKERARTAQRLKKEREKEAERHAVLTKRREIVQEERRQVFDAMQKVILKRRQVALDARLRLRQQKKANAMAGAEAAAELKAKQKEEEYNKILRAKELEAKRLACELQREKRRNDEIREAVVQLKEEHAVEEEKEKEAKQHYLEDLRSKEQLEARKRALEKIKRSDDLEAREMKVQQRQKEREKKVQEMEWLRKHEGIPADEVVLGDEENDAQVDNEDEEVLRLKLEDQARQKRKVERDKMKAAEDDKRNKNDTQFGSQKQRNLQEAKKAAELRDQEKEAQLRKDDARKARDATQIVKRVEHEKEEMERLKLWQELQVLRKRRWLDAEERQLKEAIAKSQSLAVGCGITTNFFPYVV